MKTRLFLFSAICIAAINLHAAPLNVVKVNAPAYNCLFSANCIITVNDTVDHFTTNLPPYTVGSTNPALSGFLQSRTFKAEPGTPEAGQYGYEYRLVLQKLTGVKSVTINSMTINFSPYSSFTYKGHPKKEVWVVTSGGLGSTGPGSATTSGTTVTFHFNPPLKLTNTASQETSSYFFGMASPTPPPAAANSLANFTGTEQLTGGGTIPFNFLILHVRTP